MKRKLSVLLSMFCLLIVASAQGVSKQQDLTLQTLGTVLKKNDKKPFKIIRALYGSDAQTIDVTKILAPHAQKGALFIPEEMDQAFEYSSLDADKKLTVLFATEEEKTYQLRVASDWGFPSWYNFTADEKAQTMVTHVPYKQAKRCSLEELSLLLEHNNGKSFKVVSGQYGKLPTQKMVDITKQLKPYAKSGYLMIPDDGIEFAGYDPAPEQAKKTQVVFDLADVRFVVQAADQWKVTEQKVRTFEDEDAQKRGFVLTRAQKRDMIFLKEPFQPAQMIKFEQALTGNAGAPFTIEDAFIVQPFFLQTQFDMTSTLQAHADLGKLCLPLDLKAFCGYQGQEPYMYVMKIVFIMGPWTNTITFRNDFWNFTLAKHNSRFQDMKTTCSSYVCLH